MKKRIALVSFGVGTGEFSQFGEFLLSATVALYYLKEALERAGFEILILDQPASKDLVEAKMLGQLLDFNPRVVLFSQFFSTRIQVRDFITKLKEAGVSCYFGVGGHDATFHSLVSPASYEMFDLVFQGPVMKSIIPSLEKLIIAKHAPQVFVNSLGETENPDLLPAISHSDYSSKVGFLKTSEGCLRENCGCGFCTTPQFCPTGWRPRSLALVTEEIKNLKSSGKKFVFITDDNFLGFSQKHLFRGHEIIMACRTAGLKLMIMTRPERVLAAYKKGFLALWQNTVFRVFIGVENGSPSGLQKLGKVAGREYLKISGEAIQRLKENKIAPFLGYINFPGVETVFQELEESAKFLHDLGESDMTALSQNLRPYEGTKVFEKFGALHVSAKGSELIYDFLDQRVTKFHRFLFSLRPVTDEMDNLVFSLTDYVYIFRPNTALVASFLLIKQAWSDLTYNFFIKALQSFRDRREVVGCEEFYATTESLAFQSRVLLSEMKERFG